MSNSNDDTERMLLRGINFSLEESSEFTDIAMRALQAVAQRGLEPRRLDVDILNLVSEALTKERLTDRLSQITLVRKLGATNRSLIDGYIPAAAARLGEDWVEDRKSFADVSIQTIRLHEVLRIVAGEAEDAEALSLSAPSALVVVMRGQQHTLGATVLANQFRRVGVRTDLSLDETLREVCARVETNRFDMVAISAACNQSLEVLSDFIRSIKCASGFMGKVAVGGGLTSVTADLASAVGADVATNDPARALRACGVRDVDLEKLSWTGASETVGAR